MISGLKRAYMWNLCFSTRFQPKFGLSQYALHPPYTHTPVTPPPKKNVPHQNCIDREKCRKQSLEHAHNARSIRIRKKPIIFRLP